MNLTSQQKEFFDLLQSMYPYGLRSEESEDGAVINTYDKTKSIVFSLMQDKINEGVAQLIPNTATELSLPLWEEFYGIVTNESLSVPIRRANILAKRVNTNTTLTTLKSFIATIIDDDTVNFDVFEYWKVTSDPATIFWYNVIIYDYDVVVDVDAMRSILSKIHPAECNLNNIIVIDDWWEWDNALHVMDDPRFGTFWTPVTDGGSILDPIIGVTGQDGNMASINLLVEGLGTRYTFLPRPTEVLSMSIRIEGGSNIRVGNTSYQMANEITIELPAVNDTLLVWVNWNGTSWVAGYNATTDFTVGEPDTYYNIVTNPTNIKPIAEVSLTSATTEINDTMIIDVRSMF